MVLRRPALFLLISVLFIALMTVGGCTGGKGGQKEPIRIGIIQPLTGPNAAHGTDHVNAIKLAFDDVNAQGGLLGGRKVELYVEDDRSVPSESVAAARKLITQNKVVALFGPFNSPCAFAVRDVTNENKIIEMLVGATTDSLVVGYPYVFRANTNNFQQSAGLVKWLAQVKGYKRFAILFENSDWGRNLADISTSVGQKYGAEIVFKDSYNPGTSDFAAMLTRIKAAKPDLIVLPALVTEAGIIVRQARDLGIPGSMFAGWAGFTHPEYQKLASGAEEGTMTGDTWWPENPDNKVVQYLVSEVKKRYPQTPPSAYHGQGYENAIALIDAIKRANSTDPDKLREALLACDLDGCLGRIKFDKEGQNQGIMLIPRQWRNGKLEVIDKPIPVGD